MPCTKCPLNTSCPHLQVDVIRLDLFFEFLIYSLSAGLPSLLRCPTDTCSRLDPPASPQTVHLWCFHLSPEHHQPLSFSQKKLQSHHWFCLPSYLCSQPNARSWKSLEFITHVFLCLSFLTGLPTSALFISTNPFSPEEPEWLLKHKSHITSLPCFKYSQYYPLYLEKIQTRHYGLEPFQDQASVSVSLLT